MKKFILLFISMFCFVIGIHAESPLQVTQATDVPYRLFPTNNIWTFLKLDTITGKIWQVQFSVESEDYRFETVLNPTDITEILKQDKVVGRYTLYPTSNIYNFVMLDQIDGYTYQVQWIAEAENRFIIQIPVF